MMKRGSWVELPSSWAESFKDVAFLSITHAQVGFPLMWLSEPLITPMSSHD